MAVKAKHTRIKIIFLGAIIFLVGLSVLSYIRVNNLLEASELVTHTHVVQLALEKIEKELLNVEVNQKSYLLTGNLQLLLKKDAAFKSLNIELGRVDSLLNDNSKQIKNLANLHDKIDEKVANMKQVVLLYNPIPTPEFREQVSAGNTLTQRLREQINLMQKEENELLRVRSEFYEKSAYVTPLLTIMLVLGAIVIMIASYLKISEELKTSDKLKINISKANNDLEHALETLKIKTNQLEDAQEQAHIGSWEWNVPLNKIEWSDELYRIYGLKPREFEANYENYLKYIHPDDREYANDVIQKSYQTHEPFAFFHKLLRPDGSIRVVSSTGKIFVDDQGNIVRMAGTAQDITVQKKYEEQLTESEERFLKIFDNNPIPMTLSEIKTNRIKFANKYFYSTFGYSEAEVIGHTSEELNLVGEKENQRLIALIFELLQESRTLEELQSLSVEETEELLIRLKQSDEMKNLEVLYTRKNGETFPAVISFEIIRFGEERYTITSYLDITDRKLAEELLQLQNENLVKANKELESFTYISSHDLQEPLRQIQNFASRINMDDQKNLSERGKIYFEKINHAANRMQTLIKDLLAYSRVTVNERNYETTDINSILEEVREDLSEELKEKQAMIEATDLGDADVIPFQFRQLLHNLVGNALKFSKPDTPPRIHIESEIVDGQSLGDEKFPQGKKFCHISVADNGIGFEPQYKDRIFEVFQRLHERDKISGTGIGLAIAKKIVENHNGMITATGVVDKGATFDIYIPQHKS